MEKDIDFLTLAQYVKISADCLTQLIGAVIVKDKKILGIGVNRTQFGTRNCSSGGCMRCLRRINGELRAGESMSECKCIHAEVNAINNTRLLKHNLLKANIYISSAPCTLCARQIIHAGISKVVTVASNYRASEELFRKEKISIDYININYLIDANTFKQFKLTKSDIKLP